MSILAAHAHPLPPRPPPAEPQIHRQIQQRLPSTLPPVASQSTPHPAHLPKRPTADLPAPLSSSRSMHTPASAAASSSRTSSNGVCSHLSSVLNGSADLFEKLRLGVRWSVKLASASEHDKKRRKVRFASLCRLLFRRVLHAELTSRVNNSSHLLVALSAASPSPDQCCVSTAAPFFATLLKDRTMPMSMLSSTVTSFVRPLLFLGPRRVHPWTPQMTDFFVPSAHTL